MALKLISPRSPINYASFLQLQDRLVSQMRSSSDPGYLLLMEHDKPTYTAGRRSHGFDADEGARIRALGVNVHEIGRGGLVTWHGPGQLCIYPILNLEHHSFQKSMHWYVNKLESVLIRACSSFGLPVSGGPGCPTRVGVWTSTGKKIGFIGIKNSRWVTSFGASLNVNCDLKWFEHIVPCGLEGVQVTSLGEESKGSFVDCEAVRPALIYAFQTEFNIPVDNTSTT